MPRQYTRQAREDGRETRYADMMGIYTPERARAFELRMRIEEFDALPLPRKRETIARVIANLEDEARRAPNIHSHLWKTAEAVYGIDPERITAQVRARKRAA